MYSELLQILKNNPKAWPKLVLQNKFKQEIAFNLNRKNNDIWVTNNKPKNNGKLIYALCKCQDNCNPVFLNSATPNIQLGIQTILKLYLQNPSLYAKKYGDTEHKCMYCNHPLTHPESILHGYGPICAANYSLPWGQAIKAANKAIKTSIAIKAKNTQTQMELDI